jgi:microcystin-dependent protein
MGEIAIYGFYFPPQGWATCDGTLLPISQNLALYSLLGTQFGGDGQSTFALPDLMGRVALGAGSGPGLSTYVQGQSGGSESVTLNPDQIPEHTHAINCTSTDGDSVTPAGKILAKDSAGGSAPYSSEGANGAMAPLAVQPTGGNLSHSNLQPYLALNVCIALNGMFPSRG